VARGWEVHGVTSRDGPDAAEEIIWHRADLLNPQQLNATVQSAQATHLLHLAWYIAPGRWATAAENFQWVQASLELLRAFRKQGGERIVTAGSCLEYDWDYGYCSETRTPCTPHTAYGVCKDALQTLTSAFTVASGMTSAWGRIFFLYGPYEHPDRLVASVIRSLLAGEPARCSHGNQIRDFLFAADVAGALVALLESDVTGPINVASGQPVALKEIVNHIGGLIGRPELIRLGAIPAAPTDTRLVVADTTRLADALAWRPAYNLEAGLTKTIDWWRAHAHIGAAAGQKA
jgi:nucleoside-diphosphate-sugar epimerase